MTRWHRHLPLILLCSFIVYITATFVPVFRGINFVNAAQCGNYASVSFSLEHGVNPDIHGIEGLTAMMCAARHGDSRMVALLLSHGAKPDRGLMSAVAGNHPNILRQLLNTGATTHAKRAVALEYALHDGKPDCAKVLTNNNSDNLARQ